MYRPGGDFLKVNNSFAERRDQFDRRFNFMWRFVWIFIGVTFVITIAGYIFLGYFAAKSYDSIKQDGLKGTIERIWEGEQGYKRQRTGSD